jgi:hypothetical protein
VNTFTGYACECGDGFMKVVDAATGVDTCSEINECLVSVPDAAYTSLLLI